MHSRVSDPGLVFDRPIIAVHTERLRLRGASPTPLQWTACRRESLRRVPSDPAIAADATRRLIEFLGDQCLA
jgi:hypothetical protein